ncbi:short-wave-sensitive opsin 1 [Biomphalaria pfeifferi]|uniref:Short-wave-sensitive opsin 1 n=1 Tax=Biomphalaria pfeifferi TaxID=112525 RepID=A0AAD8B8F8_BIOPF|nr:short-wave-sensitive opsin 1 [Biomphalaria pfeifferi]
MSNSTVLNNVLATQSYLTDKIIGDKVRQIWYVVLKCAMYDLFATIGIVANVINLSVFWEMGCHDSAGVTLISLTLSDLVSLLILFWMGMCYNPLFTYSDVSFDTQSVVYLSGGWLKIYISRVTSWITAFLSLERCLCIAMPLRVRRALTKSRSVYINAGIFVVIFCMLPPIYSTTWLDWQWFPDRNRTLLGLDFSSDRDHVYDTVALVNVVLTYVSFFIILACTLLLVATLNKQLQWRNATSKKLSSASSKELRVNKMIVLIALLFISFFFPGTVVLLVMVFVPEFNKGMFYNNLFTVVWAFIHILEAWNSSFNIFVYYHMSSKFRSILNYKFRCLRRSSGKTVTDKLDQCNYVQHSLSVRKQCEFVASIPIFQKNSY